MKANRYFFIFWVFISALFLSAAEGYTQACPFPVRVFEDSSDHLTIQSAYDYASLSWPDFTLLLVAETVTEDLYLDQDVSVFLDGGYDCTFSAKTSSAGILGSITISAGAVTFDNIVIQSTPICAFDSDNDGFTSIGSCTGSADDCDDNNPDTFPGAPEICDSLDNDCDGQVDEGLTATDADGDGYSAIGSCGGSQDDCNDSNPNIHPDAIEIYNDGIDQNCDGKDLSNSTDVLCSHCHDYTTWIYPAHFWDMAPDASCITCHATAVASFLDGHYGKIVKTADNNMPVGSTIGCISCHDQNHEGITGLPNIVWPKVTAVWPNENCDTCHEDRAATHGASAHQVEVGPNDLSYDPPGQLCSNCHDDNNGALGSWNDIYVEHLNDCFTCHNSPRTEVQITISSGIPPIHCLDCHSDKDLTVHGSHDATVFAWTASCGTASCHDSGTNTNISTMHNGCTTCHATSAGGLGTTVEGSAAFGIDGDARLGAGAGYASSTCLTCHPSATYSWESIHTVTQTPVDHSTRVADLASCTTSCHETTGGNIQIAVDGTAGNEVHNGCADCHTSTGALDTSKNGTGIVLGTMASGNCGQCHTSAYFDNHAHHTTANNDVSYEIDGLDGSAATKADNDTSWTAEEGCAVCHTPTGGLDTWTGILNEHETGCGRCHSYDGSGVVDGPTVTAAITSGNPASCDTCHEEKTPDVEHGSHDHSITVTGSADCVSCHEHDDPQIIAGIHGNTCATCHSSSIPEVIAAIASGQAECIDCHSAHDGPAIHNNLGAPASCSACHTDKVSGTDFNYIINNHGPHPTLGFTELDRCQRCHNSTLSEVVNTINAGKGAAGIPVDCANCHVSQHVAITNPSEIHDYILVNTGSTCSNCHIENYWSHTDMNATASCATCHASANQDEYNALHQNDCLVCHLSPRSEVISAIYTGIAGTPVDCATCHPTYASDFFGAHQNRNHSTAVSGINKCTSCHDATAGTPIGIPTSLADNMVHDDCGACHNADGTLKAGASAGSDGVANCADCHGLYNTDFAGGHQNEDHGNVAAVAPCNSCHTGNVISSARIHEDNCFTSSCHVSSSDGTLTNSAAGHTVGSPSNCSDCHGVSSHNTSTDHNNRAISWTLGTTAACNGCHSSDNDNIGQTGAGSLTSQADVDALHDKNWDGTVMANQCELCHWYVQAWDNPEGLPIAADIANYITAGKGTTTIECTDCHSYNANDHGGHTPTDFGWSPSCSGCHNEAGNSDIVASPDVHNNQCGLCHVNPGGGGTLRSYAIGQVISESTTCVTCHGTDAETTHHSATQATTGNCTWCHADPRPGWPGTAPDPIPTQLFCIKCHVEPSGTGLVVYSNTYTPVNVSGQSGSQWNISGVAATIQTPVHTITHTAKINVQNYGACLGCHDGNTPGAAQIQVWHAAPLWVKDGSAGDNNSNDDTSSSTADDAFDVLRNAPGRSYYANNNTPPRSTSDAGATERRYNIFATGANTGGMAKVRMYGRYNFGSSSKPYENTNSETRGKDLYQDYKSDARNPWVGSVWSNRLRIPRNSFNNPEGLMTSDPYVPLP